MKELKKMLLLEDNESDAFLLKRKILKGMPKVEIKHVENEKQFVESINYFNPDIILSDFSLPGFSGLDALKIVRAEENHIPFIIVTGAIDEETAVKTIKSGADDYLTKDNLIRLIPAIQTAWNTAFLTKEKKNAELKLFKSEKNYRQIFEYSAIPVINTDINGIITNVNIEACKLFGYEKQEFIGLSGKEITYKKDIASSKELFKTLKKNEKSNIEKRYIKKNR